MPGFSVPTFILTLIAAILWGFVGLVMLYHVIIALYGFGRPKMRRKVEDKTYCFAVLICARNEEAVIGQLIDSLKNQDYPKDHYTVFVTADNCTDRTAEIAGEHGAVVYERRDTEHIGKGFALRWTLQRLMREYPGRYDAITVFDADNLVDPRYLRQTNEALCTGVDATQGYRETKNPFDSVVSGCYAIYWYMLSRFYHQARSNKGMSCSIGGTGFAFKTAIIQDEGWVTETLTEDSEFASRQILKGRYVQFVRDAVCYDEQPTGWKVSLRQRMRWMCGTVQEIRLLLKPAFQSWRAGNKGAFDVMMFLLGILCMALILVASVLSLLAAVCSMLITPEYWFPIIGGTVLAVLCASYGTMFLLAVFSVVSEKKRIGKYWRSVLMFPIFMLPMIVMVFVALFKKNVAWTSIPHTGASAVEDSLLKDIGRAE